MSVITRARRDRPATGHRKGSPRLSHVVATLVEEARQAGLLDGERTEHMSFRVPAALLEAARRETGIRSPTELGIAALAALAQPDPAVAYMLRHEGCLAGLPPIEP